MRNLRILEEELAQYFDNYEIIVVSDGSRDNTYMAAQSYESDKVKIFHYQENIGKGFALKYGFSKSIGDYVIFIDGGLELHPQDIKVFLGLMDIYGADMIIGSKRHPQSDVNYPLHRRILSRIYQLLIRLLLKVNVKDTQVGLKLFRRNVLADTLPRVLVKKYAFDLELLVVANHLGYSKIIEAPIRLDFSVNQKRSLLKNLAHTFRVGWPLIWDTMAVIYRFRILKHYQQKPEEDKK